MTVPGKGAGNVNVLVRYCEEFGWSFLQTKRNRLALAQNLVIRHHASAKYIYKLDEDIFVGEGYFEGLREAYEYAKDESEYDPGIVVPLLNVNGYTYRRFLEKMDLLEEYEKQFGKALCKCMNIPAHGEGASAVYLWEKSIPFDEVVNKMKEDKTIISVCPHRFSIGAIFMLRQMWYEIGGFWTEGDAVLGREEEILCNYCMNSSKVIIVANKIFAGHFAFGPQKKEMKRFFDENRSRFD